METLRNGLAGAETRQAKGRAAGLDLDGSPSGGYKSQIKTNPKGALLYIASEASCDRTVTVLWTVAPDLSAWAEPP